MTRNELKVGDRVGYSFNFLRSIGDLTYLAHARGAIVELRALSPQTTLARVEWNSDEYPSLINVENLARIGSARWSG